MTQRIRELIGVDPAELKGAEVSGAVPFPDALLNRWIAMKLDARSRVAAVTIESHDGNRISAHVRMRSSFVPTVTVDATVEKQPEFPQSPALVLRWAPRLGPLSALVAQAVDSFARLPPWIRLQPGLATVDVAELIRSLGYGEVLPYIRSLRVRTTPGRVVLEFLLAA
ncbi:MAG TPA: hypothetical protein VFV95_19760 [Vicinamibacterales bacterium]|nr:hypothetical protein [Vicinamibacterales bacterium]